MPIQAKGAVFSAEVVPTIGGHTGWADMRAAYDALDAATQGQDRDLAAHHSLHYSQAQARPRAEEGPDGTITGYGFAGDEHVPCGRWSRSIPTPAASRC